MAVCFVCVAVAVPVAVSIGSGMAVGLRQEGRCKAFPHRICVERIQELDGAACKQGRQNSVDRPVDVMQRQHMQQVILGRVLPRLQQTPCLRRHDRLGNQHALGPVGRSGGVQHHARTAGIGSIERNTLVGTSALVLGQLDMDRTRRQIRGQGLSCLGCAFGG